MGLGMRLVDRTGERFGRLTVIARAENRGRRTFWECLCDCGNTAVVQTDSLVAGTRSCGCVRREVTAARSTTHGHSKGRRMSRTLRAYFHAKSRCGNQNDKKFPQYGGRGIRVCDRWAESFDNFLADMGECPPNMTLDRVNVDGHYEPRNCRWATSMQQARTRTDNVLVEHDGQTMVLKDYASLMGVNYKALHHRHRTIGQPLIEATQELMK